MISKTNNLSRNASVNSENSINAHEIINNKKSYFIKSPPQFGLTSLANYLIKEAWELNEYWAYVDARSAHAKNISKLVKKDALSLGLEERKVDCVVLDSWKSTEAGSKKLLKALSSEFKDIPIIVMQTIDDSKFSEEDKDQRLNREFDVLHLLALPRNQVRKFVNIYNNEKNIGDDNVVLNKVLGDIDALNIHRTPSNCLTLLKVSEKQFDESPVNRTKMIEMVLFALFDLGEYPTYKSKPDVKDCEYVLGRFCERLILESDFSFSREGFIADLKLFCEDKLLQLEIDLVFDILYTNNIIIKSESGFSFRSTYWVFYFAAQRMYANEDFCKKILHEKMYISFPEIIEFYTGIDRNRSEAIEVLIKDLSDTARITQEKTGLPDSFNPLENVNWNILPEELDSLKSEISDEIQDSKLPEELKDRHADSTYDQMKPYDQSVQTVLEEYSFSVLIQKIRAASRALRNSDYVDPDLKRKLLEEITLGWRQVSKILFALGPILAEKGRVEYDGQGFILSGDFGEDKDERLTRIFLANPFNVIGMFKDDLYSEKIGPLLYDAIQNESDNMIKHLLSLFLISERPNRWNKHIENYISKISKNSFYLLDTVNYLRGRYRYDFASDHDLSSMKALLKMGYAKHEFGGTLIKPSQLSQISNKVIPERDVPK